MSLLLKNALVIDPQSPHHNKKKDIFIQNGLIKSFKSQSAKKVIDCTGKIVTPGFLDLNANFCDPGLEHKEDLESGSRAAAFGGFTDVNLMPDTRPAIQSKSDVEYLLARQSKEVDLHVSAAVSENLQGENLTEMMDLRKAGARSFSEGDHSVWNGRLLLKALQYTAQIDVPVFQNARDPHLAEETHMHEGVVSTRLGLRGEPSISEELMLKRDLGILEYSGGHIHFSKISTAASVSLIRKAKKDGLNVTCDVAVHHLLFTDESVEDFDSTFKSLPPFRTEADRKALIKGVNDGTIDAICSGHRPQDQESKQLEFDLADPGSLSLQTFLPALLKVDGVPFDTLIDRVTRGPRNVLDMEETGLMEGSVAKLSILDKDTEWTFDEKSNLSKSTNSPFLNQNLKGKITGTVNRECVSTFN